MKTTLAIFTALAFCRVRRSAVGSRQARRRIFTGTDINDKTIHLSDYKGKVVVIESYNSDCPFCMKPLQNRRDAGIAKKIWPAKRASSGLARGFRQPRKNFSHRHARAGAQKKWRIKKNGRGGVIDDRLRARFGHLYGMLTTPHMFRHRQRRQCSPTTARLTAAPQPSGDPRHGKKTTSAKP